MYSLNLWTIVIGPTLFKTSTALQASLQFERLPPAATRLSDSRYGWPEPPPHLFTARDNSYTCTGTASQNFSVTVVNATSNSGTQKRQTGGALTVNLDQTVLRDTAGRTGYISANYQLEFNNESLADAVESDGFSLCTNGSLTHQLIANWYECLSGDFYNLYSQNINDSACSLIHLNVLGDVTPILSSSASSSSTPTPTSTSSRVTSSSSTRSSPSASPTLPAQASSSLSKGDKIAIGVAVPLGLLTIAILLFSAVLWRRKSKKTRRSDDSPKHDFDSKPELDDDSHNPAIAGPVRRKPELDAKKTAISELPQYASHELPSTDEKSMSNELSDSTTQAGSSDRSMDAAPSGQKILRKPVPSWTEGIQQPSPAPSRPPQRSDTHDQELTEELDTLVSETGVISKRKKALNNAAMASGMQPEELEGRKGEEYRELLTRERRVRMRMDEIQDLLGVRG